MATANTITILFTDLVGSTAMGDRLGDDSAEQVRRRFFAIIEEAVAPTGGRVVKTLGDGHMVAFASALDAVGCAIAIQAAVDAHNSEPDAEPIAVRVGINAGDVTAEGDDYFGTPVTVAKRICDSAQGGQILVTDLVESLVGSRGGFAFREHDALTLRGLSRPQPAREVVWRHLDGGAMSLAGTGRTGGGWGRVPAVIGLGVLAAVGAVVALLVVLGGGDDADPTDRSAPAGSSPSTAEPGAVLDVVGAVRSVDDVSTHPFVGEAGEAVRVDVAATTPDTDLVVELRANDGSLLAFDDDSGNGQPRIASATLPDDGTYEVVVRMFVGDGPGRYRADVTRLDQPAPAVPDQWYGEIAEDAGQFEVRTDLTAGDVVDVVVTSESANHADLFLELVAPDGTVAASDDDSGTYADPVVRRFLVPTTGSWLIRLHANTPDDLGAFRVEVDHR